MGPTERRFLGAAAAIAFLLGLSAPTGAAPPGASDAAPIASPTLSESPAAFAERVTAGGDGSGTRRAGSWQSAVELIALVGTCAIAVAFYSAATAQRSDPPVAGRRRRR
jgi:hypothetical protein